MNDSLSPEPVIRISAYTDIKIMTAFYVYLGRQRKDGPVSYTVTVVNIKLIQDAGILPVGHWGSTVKTGAVPEHLGQQP